MNSNNDDFLDDKNNDIVDRFNRKTNIELLRDNTKKNTEINLKNELDSKKTMQVEDETQITDSTHLSESRLTDVKLHDPDLTLCQKIKEEPSSPEIAFSLLYESVLPINSFLFLIEIENMSEKNIEYIFYNVIDIGMKMIYSKRLIGECQNSDESEKHNGDTFEENGEIIKNEQNNNEYFNIENKKYDYLYNTDGFTPSNENDLNGLKNTKDKVQYLDYIDNNIEPTKKIVNSSVDDDNIVINVSDINNPEKNQPSTKSEIIELLNTFQNLSLKINSSNNILKNMLELRNEHLNTDKSQISKHLYFDHLNNLKKTILKLSNSELKILLNIHDIKSKTDKYIKMIKALRRSIIETENLTKAISREKNEFIRQFAIKKSIPLTKEFLEIKMSFSLGGSIFAPNIFLSLAKEIIIDNKDKLIEKTVRSIIKPITMLHNNIYFKSTTEKKEEIIKFLLACLEKRNNVLLDEIDEAFKARSLIINLYSKNGGDIIDAIDKFQESYINNMIEKMSEMDEDILDEFIVIDKTIENLYAEILMSGSNDARKELAKMFKKI